MQQVSTLLSHVPVWVWLVLAYGLWAGVKALGTRNISLVMASIVPVVFLGLSLSSLVNIVVQAPAVGLVWLLALGVGGALGWYYFSPEPLEVHRSRGTLVVPGTWTFLVLFVVIFVTKYAYGYELATDPVVAGSPAFQLIVFGLSGVATGIVTGRTGRLYNYYFQTPVSEKA